MYFGHNMSSLFQLIDEQKIDKQINNLLIEQYNFITSID